MFRDMRPVCGELLCVQESNGPLGAHLTETLWGVGKAERGSGIQTENSQSEPELQ